MYRSSLGTLMSGAQLRLLLDLFYRTCSFSYKELYTEGSVFESRPGHSTGYFLVILSASRHAGIIHLLGHILKN
jgi:hypothetical protein